MPTLSELAKTQQSTSVSGASGGAVGSVGGTSIQATKQIDNSAGLTKDIGKMFGGLMQEHQQASEYAGKRVGTDNLVEYKKSINELNSYYDNKEDKTSADMVEKNRQEHGLFEHHMQKGHFGDNILANESFRDTYASPAYDNLKKNEQTNNKSRVTLYRKELKASTKSNINDLSIDISPKNEETMKQAYTAAGLDPRGVDTLVYDAKTNYITKHVNDDYKLYLSEGGNFDEEGLRTVIKDMYGSTSDTTDEEIGAAISNTAKAAVSFVSTKASKVKSEYSSDVLAMADSRLSKFIKGTDVNGNLYTFDTDPKVYQQALFEAFPDMDNDTLIKAMQKFDRANNTGSQSYMDTTDIKIKLAEIKRTVTNGHTVPEAKVMEVQAYMSSINQKNISDGDRKTLAKSTHEVDGMIRRQNASMSMASKIAPDMSNEQISSMNTAAEIGFKMEDGTSVSSREAKSAINSKIKQFENNLSSIPLSKTEKDKDGNDVNVGYKIFVDSIKTLNNTTTAVGGEPYKFSHYRNALSNSNESFTSVDDAMKSVIYNDWKSQEDTSLAYTWQVNRDLKTTLERTDYTDNKGNPLEGIPLEVARLTAFDDKRKAFMGNQVTKSMYKDSISEIITNLPRIADGSSEWGTILNSTVNEELAPSLVSWARGNNLLNAPEGTLTDAIDDLNFAHAGTLWKSPFHSADVTIVGDNGQDMTALKEVIDQKLEATDGYSYSNIKIQSTYKSYLDPITKMQKSGWVQVITTENGRTLHEIAPSQVVVNKEAKRKEVPKNTEPLGSSTHPFAKY